MFYILKVIFIIIIISGRQDLFPYSFLQMNREKYNY